MIAPTKISIGEIFFLVNFSSQSLGKSWVWTIGAKNSVIQVETRPDCSYVGYIGSVTKVLLLPFLL